MTRLLIVFSFVFLLVGCGQAEESVDETTTTRTDAETTTTGRGSDTTEPSPDGEVPEAVLEAIRADAAKRAGVDPASVEVASVTAEEFSDSSLGCPEPGELYTQVITPGYVVIVDADDREFDYRVGSSPETWKLCEE